MGEWQPIETAPKDGVPILLFGGRPDRDSDYTEWDGSERRVSRFPSPMVAGWWDDWGWRYCSYDSHVYGEWDDPTHWQPLPQPPL